MSAPTGPALLRQGVYTALGASLVAGAALLIVAALNPPPKPTPKAGGCGCGCTGAKAQASVYS